MYYGDLCTRHTSNTDDQATVVPYLRHNHHKLSWPVIKDNKGGSNNKMPNQLVLHLVSISLIDEVSNGMKTGRPTCFEPSFCSLV